MLTHIVRRIFRTPRLTNFNLGIHGWRTTTRISHRRHNLQGRGRKVTVLAQCCTCVTRGGQGHTVSAEPGGYCNFSFRNTCQNDVNFSLKATKCDRRPIFARFHWGAHNAPPDPLVDFEGVGVGEGGIAKDNAIFTEVTVSNPRDYDEEFFIYMSITSAAIVIVELVNAC